MSNRLHDDSEAEKLCSEAKSLAKKEDYIEALKMLRKAARLARYRKTMSIVTKQQAKILSLQRESINQQTAQQLLTKGTKLAEQNSFLSAHQCFNQALKLAKTDKPLIRQIKLATVKCLQREKEKLNEQFDELIQKSKFQEAKKKIQEIRRFQNRNISRKRGMEVESLDQRLQNAENASKRGVISAVNDRKQIAKLLETAKFLVVQKKFYEADDIFEQALFSTEEKDLIASIEKERSKATKLHVEAKQKEANDLANLQKFSEAKNLFEEASYLCKDEAIAKTVRRDQERALGEQIKLLKDKAEAFVTHNLFEEAYSKFDEAMDLAGETSFFEELKARKVNALNQEGLFYLDEGFGLEAENSWVKCQEAAGKFNRAKSVFQTANEEIVKDEKVLKASKVFLEIVDLKIEGNEFFNNALEEEEAGYKLYSSAKSSDKFDGYLEAQMQYQKAIDLYKSAKNCYEEGYKKKCEGLLSSVDLVKQIIEALLKTVKHIDTIKLKYSAKRK